MKYQHREYLDAAIELAKEAGGMIRLAFSKDKNVEIKGGQSADLVTETDTAVEEFLFSELRKRFADDDVQHCFIGEESTSAGGSAPTLTDNPTWIIDPVDGTTNFVHNAVAGVVYNPILDELFTAIKGQGSYCNGVPISSCQQTDIDRAMIAINFPYERTDARIANTMSNLTSLLKAGIQGIRSAGSAALDMCNVACGRTDGYYECGIKPWDITAGKVIVEEAGGCIIHPKTSAGEPFDVMVGRIVVGSSAELTKKIDDLMEPWL